MYNATSKEVWKTWLAARCPHPKTSQGQHAVQMPVEHFHGILGGWSHRHHGHVYIWLAIYHNDHHNGPKVWPNNPSHLYATCIGARASQFGIRQKLQGVNSPSRSRSSDANCFWSLDPSNWDRRMWILWQKSGVWQSPCFFSGRQSSWLSNWLLPHWHVFQCVSCAAYLQHCELV